MDSKEQKLLKQALKDFPSIIAKKKKAYKKKQKILKAFDKYSKELLKKSSKQTQSKK